MKVYTVQRLETYYRMREQGYLIGDQKFVWEDFKKPYQWMMKQMEKKIEGYNGKDYPIWVWKRKVNRNEHALLSKGIKGVILTLEIPEDKILWSDFDHWHFVLNNGPITESEDEWERYLEDEESYPTEDSWEKIFDFNLLRSLDNDWNGKFNEDWIQGVTPKITMSMVKKVTRFIAKGSKHY